MDLRETHLLDSRNTEALSFITVRYTLSKKFAETNHKVSDYNISLARFCCWKVAILQTRTSARVTVCSIWPYQFWRDKFAFIPPSFKAVLILKIFGSFFTSIERLRPKSNQCWSHLMFSHRLFLFFLFFAISSKQQLGWCNLTFWVFERQKWMDVYKNNP